jgi:hypothetical protein
MRVTNLLENEAALTKVLSDIEQINNHKEHFFYDRFSDELDDKEVKAFDSIKTWKPVFSIEDSCLYASELAYLVTDDKRYALISHYNAGGSVLDHTKIIVAENKQELKEAFTNLFAFNGLDSVTDKRVAPRFDFDALVDSFPELNKSPKRKLK